MRSTHLPRSSLASEVQRAVQSLKVAAFRTSGRPLLVSRAVDLLALGGEVLEHALGEWKTEIGNLARDVERERRERIVRAGWDGARAGVAAAQRALQRLRLLLSADVHLEHRLALEEAQADLERLRVALDPTGRAGGEAPPRRLPGDPRAWTIPVLVLPHLWTTVRALRELREQAGSLVSPEEREIIAAARADVTALGEELGSELRTGGGRPRLADVRARFGMLEDGLCTAWKRVPESLPPGVLRNLDQAMVEVRSVRAQLEELWSGARRTEMPPSPRCD